MPPAVSRMHPSHMSNPFQHINQHHAIQSSHYQSQTAAMPSNFGSHQGFGQASALNGGISPFNPSSAYGGSAFSTGAAGAALGNGGMLQGSGLASEAAQRGFLRGAAMQDHQQQEAAAASMGMKNSFPRIRDVWKSNLDQEMAVLRQLITKYPYVSMDAEFPGIVARPIGNFAGSKAEYHYQTLRCNVDILKPIQVGITLWSANGELPPQQPDPALLAELTGGRKVRLLDHNGFLPCTWVFNFHFDLEADMYADSSIELLKTSGVDFQKHQEFGIDLNAFGSLITTSGLAFSEDINWLSFHSGYDFGYLIKLLTNDALPPDQNQFFELVSTFFPKLWDIKFLLRDAQKRKMLGRIGVEGARILDSLGQKSGLQDLADELGCERVGRPHTGGSDAWLTGSVFWAMRSKIFAGNLEPELADQIYGLHGVPVPASQHFREEFFAAQGTPQQGHQQANGGLSGAATALSNALQGGAAGYTPNNPSTPTSQHVGLSGVGQTPGPQYGNHGLGGGSLSQGGFGNFTYPK